jgi:hypothetical protein
MNLHAILQHLAHTASSITLPPASFDAGLLSGLLVGMVLMAVVLRSGAITSGLMRLAHLAAFMVPPVIACLLWGAWVGIMAAKEMLH